MNRANKLCGRPLQWGDADQISELRKREYMLKGELNIGEADWAFGKWAGKPGYMGAPLVYYSTPKSADCVFFYINCPDCGRQHKHIVGYDPTALMTEQWVEIDAEPIECWNCGLEMYIDQEDNNIYVKQ